jgi:rhodanese-related sulfurtransferase
MALRVVSSVGDVHIPAVSVDDTWAKLKSDAGAVLVDVRTIAEWAYVGLPDLSAIGKRPVLVEMAGLSRQPPEHGFVERLTEALAPLGADKGTEIFFHLSLGRPQSQGGQAMAAAGYMRCRNVTDGFEGPLDPSRHRGQLGGWKAKGCLGRRDDRRPV